MRTIHHQRAEAQGRRQWLKRTLLLPAMLGIGLFVLAACGGSDPAPTPTATSVGSAATSSPGVSVPFDFEIMVYQGADEVGGETLQFSDLFAQGKPVVLNFWAGQCPPCRAEMPDLQEVYEEFGDRIVLFGLDVGVFTFLGTREEGRELLQELEVTYPAGSTLEGFAVRAYEVLGMPTTVFMTPNGELMRTWSGLLTKDKMVDIVQQLLAVS